MQQKYRILLLDDNADILEAAGYAFREAGFEVVLCDDGFTALRHVITERFDIIMTDYMMPMMDGVQFATHVKVTPLNARSPIFFLSGALTSEVVHKLNKMGIAEVIKKPYDLSSMVTLVTQKVKGTGDNKRFHPDLIELLRASIENILKFYLGNNFLVHEPIIHRNKDLLGGYASSITLFGQTIYGCVTSFASSEFLQKLAGKLFGAENIQLTAALYSDVLGEMVNQLSGDLKIRLSQKGLNVLISLPEVGVPSEIYPFIKLSEPRLCFPMSFDGAKAYVEYTFGDPTFLKPDSPHASLPIYQPSL